MRIFAGFLWVGASNDSGVVDGSNFGRFMRLYFFGNFRDKISNTGVLYGDMLPLVSL